MEDVEVLAGYIVSMAQSLAVIAKLLMILTVVAGARLIVALVRR